MIRSPLADMANEKRKRSIKWKPGHACFLRSPSTHPFRVVRPEKQRRGCVVQAFSDETAQERFVEYDGMLPFECHFVRRWRENAGCNSFRAAAKAALEEGVCKLEGTTPKTPRDIWEILFNNDEVFGSHPNGHPLREEYPF